MSGAAVVTAFATRDSLDLQVRDHATMLLRTTGLSDLHHGGENSQESRKNLG